jgi:hypothetical protein
MSPRDRERLMIWSRIGMKMVILSTRRTVHPVSLQLNPESSVILLVR